MDDAGAGVHGDIVREHAEDLAVEEGMLEVEALELASGKVREFAGVRESAFFSGVFRQLRGDNVDLAAGFQSHVFFVGVEGHGHRGGQRPGSCRPDDGKNSLAGERGVEFGGIV